MSMDFHSDAVEFVRRRNCANHAPVELIESAMKYGALAATNYALKIVAEADKEITKLRKDSLPHTNLTRTIMI